MRVKQESFHAYFVDCVHSGEGDWEVRLIDHSDSTDDLSKRRIILVIWTWHFSDKWFKWAWSGSF